MFSKPLRPPINKVIICSLDADSCVLNERYYGILLAAGLNNKKAKLGYKVNGEDPVVKANPKLIQVLKEIYSTKADCLNYQVCGSFRQSEDIDEKNNQDHGSQSFFMELTTLHAHLKKSIPNLILDKFLLADLAFDPPRYGYSFDKVLGIIKDNNPHPTVSRDRSKIILLMIQMYYFASLHPEALLEFHFFDDHQENILAPLEAFFDTYSEMIPFNMDLHTHHYDGLHLDPTYEKSRVIKGCGPIDSNIREVFYQLMDFARTTQQARAPVVLIEYSQFIERLGNLKAYKQKRGLDYEAYRDLEDEEGEDDKTPASIMPSQSTALIATAVSASLSSSAIPQPAPVEQAQQGDPQECIEPEKMSKSSANPLKSFVSLSI